MKLLTFEKESTAFMKKFVCCYMVKNHILPNIDNMKINGERKKKRINVWKAATIYKQRWFKEGMIVVKILC